MSILINTTILSNFAAVGRLDLLQALYKTVLIAHPVYEEIQRGWEEGYNFLADLEAHIFPFYPDGWLHLVGLEGQAELALYQTIPTKLHRGEAVSLTIAAQRGYQFLTDDQAARRYAAQMDVSVGGTLGILIQLIKREMLTLEAANEALRQMIIKAKYRSPVTDLGLLLTSDKTDEEKQ
jgi:predicted nucleic acid-binding protein